MDTLSCPTWVLLEPTDSPIQGKLDTKQSVCFSLKSYANYIE
jgi:hypothetical protein